MTPTNDLASQPIITVPAIKWKGFLEIVASRGSSSDVSAGIPAVELDGIGGATLRDADGTTLVYTPTEWDAFSAGIVAGEFALA